MEARLRYYLLLLTAASVYFSVSKIIFDRVDDAVMIVIDELFHIPQGLEYCDRNFLYYDSKITTLPGLYLVSAALLSNPYVECNKYNLRFVNLLASCVNLLLFASILKFVYYNEHRQSKIVLQAVSLALLPPLYFFSHVYYTDTLSLTFLLAYSRLCFQNKHTLFIVLLGACSILMRQTNVCWIAMVCGHKFLDILIKSSRVFGNTLITNVKLSKQSLIAQDVDSSKLKRYYGLKDVVLAVSYHITTCFKTFFRFLTLHDIVTLVSQSVLLIGFLAFVFINGSIVLGDKTAHEACLHLPQLLYFLIFYGIFGLPYVVAKLKSTLLLMFRNKIKVILFGIIMALIVHFNTIEHPYLLADNRHFTFYIWNRWYRKYDFAIYVTIPAYIFLLFSIYDNLRDQNCISFLLPYSVALILVLALQKMIEVRYFLIPYIILRLRFVKATFGMALFEFLWYVLINYAAFHVFFNKEILWQDFNHVQRIIW